MTEAAVAAGATAVDSAAGAGVAVVAIAAEAAVVAADLQESWVWSQRHWSWVSCWAGRLMRDRRAWRGRFVGVSDQFVGHRCLR